MTKHDWREGYVICEHLAKNPDLEATQRRFRVCCIECSLKGFLREDLEKHQEGKLSIGKIRS